MVIKQIKTLISIKEVNKQSKAKQRSKGIKIWKATQTEACCIN